MWVCGAGGQFDVGAEGAGAPLSAALSVSLVGQFECERHREGQLTHPTVYPRDSGLGTHTHTHRGTAVVVPDAANRSRRASL